MPTLKGYSAKHARCDCISKLSLQTFSAYLSRNRRSEEEAKANIAGARMTTSATSPNNPSSKPAARRGVPQLIRHTISLRFVREILIVIAFCLLTSLMTWPYVTRLKDAVAGPGDPYLVTWIMWWDYHQTFHDPLHLFHANVFYPYRYSLAFSEHCYGLSLPFFVLFALGFRPLTVHAVAMFLGFALSGYAAFRLARTLTGSYGIAWVAGIIFAFVPYRFNMMAQLVYLFSVWIPLVFEALILFARERSRKRAVWLGVAVFMIGLTSVSWFLLSLIPLAIYAAILLTRYDLWRERDFWRRGAVAIGVALLGLTPFMVPYYIVSKMYGFKRRIEDVKAHSAMPYHWLVAEGRNKLWAGMGATIPEAWKFQMFPGLMTLLLPLAELLSGGPVKVRAPATEDDARRKKWVRRLDVLAVAGLILSVPALGFDGTEAFGKIFLRYLTSERALTFLSIVVIARLCLSYPQVLRRGEGANLIETLRSERRSDAFWLGVLLTVIGFFYSIGWNFFFYRILYDLMPGFKSMRAPMRGAVFAYLGLAILAGLGARRLAQLIGRWRERTRPVTVYAGVCVLLLVELNAAPLSFIRGDVYPDAVTLRLKATSMRGGIAYLPAGVDFNQRYMLRAADHAKPLIVATSGFNPPYVDQIEKMTAAGPVPSELMDLLERIPASYLVVANELIVPERKADFEVFVARAVASGRLRFINRFDGRDDLYAVVKSEPESKSEAPLPPDLSIRDWAAKIHDDSVNLLDQPKWSQRLYRIYLASSGALPRYADFISDVEKIGLGVGLGAEEQERQVQSNLSSFAEAWVKRDSFIRSFGGLDNGHYVDRLLENAGARIDASQRAALINGLESGQDTRAGVLLKIVDDPIFVEKESNRSLLLLHYFAYLRRNPGEPPDRDLSGFDFWLRDLETNHNPAKLSSAFKDSLEYHDFKGTGAPGAR